MANENSNNPEVDQDKFDETAMDENMDDSKMKFLNANGDDPHVKVEISSSSDGDGSFTGLGKEELMKYATDPFWVRTRKILFGLFWIGWVGMLVAAILIIVFAPKCPERPDLKWFQKDVIYQIQPKSFKDTTKDPTSVGAGVGDLQGILEKVPYLEDLGANTMWINSIFKSGGLYDGNDVEDHKAVDEIFGGMAAFDLLRKETKKKGMKMILDFIPNHTGKKHEWFVKSEAKDADYADFYIWADGDSSTPPNNWKTTYGEPAWTYSADRKQWYYHSYMPEYPDLNLRNDEVIGQLDGIMRFWLEKGIDGFAIQGLQRLVEGNDTSAIEFETGEQTNDQPENLKLVSRWRGIVDSFSDKPGRERALIGSVAGNANLTAEYAQAGMHVVTSQALVGLNPAVCNQACFKETLEKSTGASGWKGWMVDNENSGRFASLLDSTQQMAMQVLHLLLPGTPIIYYGDEIGMKNGQVSSATVKDPLNAFITGRDAYRTPMLWKNMPNAGFCAADITPWLPIGDFESETVEYNHAHLQGYNIFKSFNDLTVLRKNEAFQFGSIEIGLLNDQILYFTRKAKGFPSYLVVINKGARTVGFSDVADSMTLVYDSAGVDRVGETFNLKEAPIAFANGEIYVFQF
ncbi:maltase 2-like [Mya arenaria]|uniref:maltase 2-like n=1 Tax=Mya arenaria TaxID=6604 RepID=UPI0022E319B3|nr:maltase 2-like [Mya arenaria]